MTQSSTYTCILDDMLTGMHTVNVEIFAGLNICCFSPMKFFAGMLSWCLGQWCLLFRYN